mgnify:CR=1 FL=1
MRHLQHLTSHRLKALFTPIALGYAAFFALLLFSVLFYLERACYADIAFQIFEIINSKNVAYQLDRFGTALIQIFPLAAVLLELPLKYVLLTYSVALVAQNLFFFWLLHKFFRQKEIALVLALFCVLMVTETFYWATNEIKQGFSFSILLAGIIGALPLENFKGIRKFSLMLFYLLLIIITVFLHPLVVVAVLFVLGYTAIHAKKFFSQTALWGLCCVAIILSVKYFFLPVAPYDAEQLSLRENFVAFFPNYMSMPSFEKFLDYCINDWYLYAIILVGVIGFYVWNRQWLKLGWLSAFSLGYLLLVNVTHPNSEKVFIECYYQALAVFVLFPFVIELLPVLPVRYILLIVTTIFFLRINTIYHTHHKYSKRLTHIQKTLATFMGKFVIPIESFPMHKEMMTWGIPYESAMLSSAQSPDSCRSFAVLRDVSKVNEKESEKIFYTVFDVADYANLNPVYFRPATGSYRILTETEIAQLHLSDRQKH